MRAPSITLFLCGDVMTGRGIDQILPHPSVPRLYEPCVISACDYVDLAERAHGRIDRPVRFDYLWSDVLSEFGDMRPDARVINLETAVTISENAWPGKGIHYRMHPGNVPSLTSAGIDCCTLANNHSLDWGREGLEETIVVLHRAGLRTAGAGTDIDEASEPARIDVPEKGRVLVFACGTADSGISVEWAATHQRSGVHMLNDLKEHSLDEVSARIQAKKRPGDVVVLSLHWGGNWGYAVTTAQRDFAHRLIEVAGVDVVHGHSSHHPKEIEVYRGKLILYGCGDLLNDYEGIGGHDQYRPELGLMYFPAIDVATGDLRQLIMTPVCVRRLRLNRASRSDAGWLCATLNRHCRRGTACELRADSRLELSWEHASRASLSRG